MWDLLAVQDYAILLDVPLVFRPEVCMPFLQLSCVHELGCTQMQTNPEKHAHLMKLKKRVAPLSMCLTFSCCGPCIGDADKEQVASGL